MANTPAPSPSQRKACSSERSVALRGARSKPSGGKPLAQEEELDIPIFDLTSLGVWKALGLPGINTSPGAGLGRGCLKLSDVAYI